MSAVWKVLSRRRSRLFIACAAYFLLALLYAISNDLLLSILIGIPVALGSAFVLSARFDKWIEQHRDGDRRNAGP